MKNLLGLAKMNWLSTQKRHMMIFIIYLQPVFLLVMYGLANPYSKTDSVKAFWFVVINASALSCWSINVFSTISDIHRDRWTGLLDVIRCSATRLETIFIIRSLTNTFHSISSMLILIVGSLILLPELSLKAIEWQYLIGLIFLFIIIGLFSLLFAAFIGMSPIAHTVMNFIEYPVFIFTGIGFTVGLLPGFLQWLAMFFPFGYLAEWLRLQVGISNANSLVMDLGLWVAISGTLFLTATGLLLLRMMNQRLDEKGALL